MNQQPITNPEAPIATLTSHAMLIPWGLFAQRMGLVEALEGISIPQRTREHTPQAKLIEFLVSGDTVSLFQAEAMVRSAEARTGARPWRRTDLLAERITQHRIAREKEEAKLTRAQGRVERAQVRLAQVDQERCAWAQQVAELEADYQARSRSERPHSRLAQARRKLSVQSGDSSVGAKTWNVPASGWSAVR